MINLVGFCKMSALLQHDTLILAITTIGKKKLKLSKQTIYNLQTILFIIIIST